MLIVTFKSCFRHLSVVIISYIVTTRLVGGGETTRIGIMNLNVIPPKRQHVEVCIMGSHFFGITVNYNSTSPVVITIMHSLHSTST